MSDTNRRRQRVSGSKQRDLFAPARGLTVEKLAELAAWGAGRAPQPSWLLERKAAAPIARSSHRARPRSREGEA